MRYSDYRQTAKTGDVFLFDGGKGSIISRAIQLGQRIATRSPWWRFTHAAPVSHIGARVKLIESTSLQGFNGVVQTFASERLRNYVGTLYVCRSRVVMTAEEAHTYVKFLELQVGKPYDAGQAIGTMLPRFMRRRFDKDSRAFFCSEVLRAATNAIAWTEGLAKLVRPCDVPETQFAPYRLPQGNALYATPEELTI